MASILVIEDDAALRGLLVFVLSDAGHSVRQAGDGIDGIAAVAQEMPDLVVTDLVMPNREGIETILRLVGMPHRPKIVAISGAPLAHIYLPMAVRLGADRCLQKPFRNAELLAAVDELLNRAEPADRSLRFVVLDDDAGISLQNRRQLEKTFPGCQVAECASADEAFAECASRPVDAVIADHHLRGTDGIAVVSKLREQQLRCPIFMVTGSSDPEVASRAYAAGVTRVFSPGEGSFAPLLRQALVLGPHEGPRHS